MAKIFRRQRQLHPVAELNVTNMVDLGFTLLIIFMITTPLIQQEQTIPLNLPGESKKPQVPPESEFQTVSIDQSGKLYVGSKPVSFAELSRTLTEFAARSKPPIIRIRADMSLQYQQVVRVMDELTKRGLTRISLDTESK
ncbi:biopolymer transporter ExbD [Opitutus sp. GAS368]|jgi:biopolymer transport protein TolR|uniref:ExbD/TolR family protein n=1 Tax=Opitutus sp. GAS368 TaxID=1882749 RepID=UPI00087C8C8A|nr:biopolymer transporter ExbD [Opitutus sp. GAS368]SDS57938.1 biopolymer transport protein ExbD [Opitutus sp. GAS368]